MLRVAEDLGVGVTSLYWHLRSKQELLDELAAFAERTIDEVLPIVPESPEATWRKHLVAFWMTYRSALRGRPILADLTILGAQEAAPCAAAVQSRAARMDREVAVLRDAGFAEEAAIGAYSALAVFTRSSILCERLYLLAGRPSDGTVDPSKDFALDWDAFPRLLASVPYWTPSLASYADFAFGVQTIVDGLAVQGGRR